MVHLVRPHQYIVIFDADNLAHPDFLKETDRYVTAGFTCIQGERTAKNTDNNFAAPDSLGEHYKNYIDRYAPFVLGSSSVISGSGMATETSLYSDYLNSPAIQEGQYLGKKMLQEDKILQNFILNQGGRIAFAKSAVCYDEKVQSAAAVETQRSRWLFSYFQNLPNTFGHFFRGVFSLNWNRFFFGLITLPLPMFLQVGVAGLIFILGLFLDIRVSMAIAVTMLIFAGTVLLSLSYSGVPGLVAKALTALPSFIWRQARALLKMRNPQKNFQHTEHSKVVTLDDVIKEDKP